MKRRAVYQVMLYTMVSSITFNVFIAAKQNANYVWLELSTVQNQVLNIVESLLFALGLALVRQYGLNFSWRKMIWIGSVSWTYGWHSNRCTVVPPFSRLTHILLCHFRL